MKNLQFNKKLKKAIKLDNRSQKVDSLQGGTAYTYKALMGLVSILTTKKFDKDTFFRTNMQEWQALKDAVDECVRVYGAETTAKAIVYCRTKDGGMRTASHLAATQLMKYLSGKEWGRLFFTKYDKHSDRGGVVFRIDDAMAIAATYLSIRANELGRDISKLHKPFKNLSMPNAMRRGLRIALEGADWYELAKYQSKGAVISLADLINLCHPKPENANPKAWRWIPFAEFEKNMQSNITPRNKKAIEARIEKERARMDTETGNVRIHAFTAAVNGWLKQENTKENMNSAAGQEIASQLREGKITKAEAEVKLVAKKSDNFSQLISTRKIGYYALIRGLREIHEVLIKTQDKTLLDKTCALIEDKKLCRQSLIWPAQLEKAYEIMLEIGSPVSRILAKSVVNIYDTACKNLEELGYFGRSAVVIDSSGSMGGTSNHAHKRDKQGNPVFGRPKSRFEIACLIGATIAKGVNGDLYQFADGCGPIAINHTQPAFSIAAQASRREKLNDFGVGTNIASIFDGNYDRGWGDGPKKGAPLVKRGVGIKPCERIFIISDMQNGCRDSAYRALLDWEKRNNLSNTYVYLINVNAYGTTAMPDATDKRIINVSGWSFEMLANMVKNEVDPHALFKTIEEVNMSPKLYGKAYAKTKAEV
jgi:hypothetical protein